MENAKKIKVFNKNDRLTIAAILADNGYKVWISKEKRTPDKRSYEYCVYYIEQAE